MAEDKKANNKVENPDNSPQTGQFQMENGMSMPKPRKPSESDIVHCDTAIVKKATK